MSVKALKTSSLNLLKGIFAFVLMITPIALSNSSSLILWQEPEVPECFED